MFIQRFHTYSFYSKILDWSKLIAITGSAQAIIQAIGFISGVLIIRILSTSEYALYTLANTMLGTMLVLADGGISASVMAQGGKVWQNRGKLGSVLVTGFDLRKKFAIGSLVIAIPVLFYLLRGHGAGTFTSILIVGSLVPAFYCALSGNLLAVGPTLHQMITPLQKINISVSLLRLLSLLSILLIFPFAYIAIFAASLPQIWANFRLRSISAVYADWQQPPDSLVRNNILTVVKRIFPGSIYYCLSGQITIWLISIFGTTAAVAQIGALGRLSMMLNLFSATFTTLIIPRFARLENNKALLFKRFLHMSSGLTFLFSIIIIIVSKLPTQLLWLLGKSYSGLEHELVLSVAGSCLSLMAGLLFTIATSRNWAINPLVSIPITLVSIICAISLIDISSLRGILKLNLFVSSAEVGMYFIYCSLKIRKIN
ncbi:polysaccharide biosynthesis protein [Flavisolibacter tropicus]|uniref:Polysaccharide biosynthesis protein n=1 Tax=Flavisolibacter tropicus TaxID=1492898 RepID=A0A172TQB6_9BACT|nr:polysaccharide biosynthesis protein [Flavisolibacter tropicus]ANE49255.1 polysaccharide biosynthesis protein [Flavisolibacter tropicus]